jgi:hypothetical protein
VGALFAQELRTWTDIKGNHVEASFVKQDSSAVVLKLKDGRSVPTKLENLCEEDRIYVKEQTYVPREVVVTFKRNGYGAAYEASGNSPDATVRDLISLRIDDGQDGKKTETIGDSRWKIESVDSLGSRILSRKEGSSAELVTDGKFIFVTYSVENDSNVPTTVPSPILIDKRGRKFIQVDKPEANTYIPQGTFFAGVETVPPGFKKPFCSFYEIPTDAEPAAVEIFPTKTSKYVIQRFEAKGKQVLISGKDSTAVSSRPTGTANPGAIDKKVSVFMKCARVGQGGDTSGYWYYDRTKKRSLSYGVELRVIGNEQQSVVVKAFFIGSINNNRDVVVDQKEEKVVLESGKISRISLQSDEVEEYTNYYFSDSRISGAKLKGIIVQVWCGDDVIASFVSLSQWKKFSEISDIPKQMGELTKRRSDL